MKSIRRSAWLIIIALVAVLLCGTVTAADNNKSDYAITFDLTGVTSSYDHIDETSHKITGQPTLPPTLTATQSELSVEKTYFFKYTKAEFSITNKTGVVILPTSVFKVDDFDTKQMLNFLAVSPNWSKDAAALSVVAASRSVLEAAKYDLDADATAFYYLYFTTAGLLNAPQPLNFAILIEITPNSTEPPKPLDFEELNTQLARVADDKKDNWYTSDDRWNGISYSKAGFWADLTEYGGPLETARKALLLFLPTRRL